MASAKRVSHLREPKGYAKRMSDNIAIALVTYTLMLIFVVTPNIETKGMSIFPYFLLVVLVAAIIPVFRRLDHRWIALEHSELSSSGLKTRYAMDRIKLWVMAIGIPLILSVMCRTVAAAF